MKLTKEEKARVMEQVRSAIENEYIEKEDAVIILDVISRAVGRYKERLLEENPWLKESDIVQ